jgi:hypothetical protein
MNDEIHDETEKSIIIYGLIIVFFTEILHEIIGVLK